MGFISGTSTVTVQAKLTDAGKKKLYDSIENRNQGFITQFSIGDSDANYSAIDAGTGHLLAGHVPEVGGFLPSMRSFVLHSGQYKPGIPIITIDGEYGSNNGISKTLIIGTLTNTSETVSTTSTISTEWPKNEKFSEGYMFEIPNVSNFVTAFGRYFSVQLVSNQLTFTAQGPIGLSDLGVIAGIIGSTNSTGVPVKIIGTTTNASVIYNIKLKY
jgi:hypothetical protein